MALIRHLNAGPAVVIGDSMAAGATVWAAAEAPELLAGAILVGPFVRSEPSLFTSLLFGALFSRPWGPTMWQWYYKTLYPTRKPEDFAEYVHKLRKNLAEPGRLEALQKMLAASKSASEQRLAHVKAPALVLMGTKDPDFKAPETEARWVAEKLNAQLHMIEGAGHYPHAEMPEVVAPLVLAFLAQHTPSSHGRGDGACRVDNDWTAMPWYRPQWSCWTARGWALSRWGAWQSGWECRRHLCTTT